eukprot:1943876-Rhodomonas_salina.1
MAGIGLEDVVAQGASWAVRKERDVCILRRESTVPLPCGMTETQTACYYEPMSVLDIAQQRQRVIPADNSVCQYRTLHSRGVGR